MLISNNQKEFELPKNGTYVGTIVDVVDLGEVVDPRFGKKFKLRVVWLLNKNDSTNQPYQVMQQVNAVMADKPKESALYKLVRSVLGVTPPVPFETEQLIGKANELFIVQEAAQNGKTYANIKAILPLTSESRPIAIPANYVRAKDKAARQTQTQTASAPSNTTPPQAALVGVSTAPAYTGNNVAEQEIPF